MSDTNYKPPTEQGIDLPPIPVDHGHTIRDFKAHYREGMDYLDSRYAFFLTHVLNIGSPEWVNDLPTAAVGFRPESGETPDDFRFLFNGDFLMSLEASQVGFVAAHETMHILLDHLSLFSKNKKKFPNPRALNVAADCVINDYLAARRLDVPEWVCRGEKIVGYNCANATVGDVYRDIENIIQQLQDDECPQCGGSGEVPDESGDGDSDQDADGGDEGADGEGGQGEEGTEGEAGQGGEGEGEAEGQGGGQGSGHSHDPNATKPCPHCNGTGDALGGGQFDDHSWMQDPSKKMEEAVEKLRKEAMKQKGQAAVPKDLKDKADEDNGKNDKSRGLMPGMGISDAGSFAEIRGVSLKWVDLLKEIDPDVINTRPGPPPRPSYHTPRRKLAGVRMQYPDLNLPVMKKRGEDKGELPSIVMALDTSGSIGHEDANRFINLAKSIPTDKIHLFCCTFTSQYKPLDLEDPKWVSGGTHFGCIEEFIQKEVIPSDEFKKTRNKSGYPNAVVVVTDGFASFGTQGGVDKPLPEFCSNWFWLIMNFESYKSGTGWGGSYWNGIKDIGRHESLGKFTEGTKMAKEMAQYK